MGALPGNVHVSAEDSSRIRVFADRREAGERLAEMLAPLAGEEPVVLAIPAGGVPVAEVIARRLGVPLAVWVVSKATPSWNSEVGFAAVAADGTEVVDQEAARRLGLGDEEVAAALQRARERVARRQQRFLSGEASPSLKGRTVILVDDGLATGKTMEAAIRAVRHAGAQRVVVAVPTAHEEAVHRITPQVDALYCPNLRRGVFYAVAEAYRHWHDVSEEEVEQILKRAVRAELRPQDR